jgi:hypothetical protein
MNDETKEKLNLILEGLEAGTNVFESSIEAMLVVVNQSENLDKEKLLGCFRNFLDRLKESINEIENSIPINKKIGYVV